MLVEPNLSTPENLEYWEFVKKTSEEVRSWPAWMRGGYSRKEGDL